MPISPAGPSTIWLALICPQCCGANCQARAQPAACNLWRFASLLIASSRLNSLSRKNIGPLAPICGRQMALISRPAFTRLMVSHLRSSICLTRPALNQRSIRSKLAVIPSTVSKPSRSSVTRHRPLSRRPCSRTPRASSASPPSAQCKPRKSSTKKAASLICGPTASTWRKKPIRPLEITFKATMARNIFQRSRGATRPSRRMRKRLTKPFGRPTLASARMIISNPMAIFGNSMP